MTNPMIRIHNVTTGEIIDRKMTDAEFEELQNPKPVKRPGDLENVIDEPVTKSK